MPRQRSQPRRAGRAPIGSPSSRVRTPSTTTSGITQRHIDQMRVLLIIGPIGLVDRRSMDRAWILNPTVVDMGVYAAMSGSLGVDGRPTTASMVVYIERYAIH